jgi:hypothetical protein
MTKTKLDYFSGAAKKHGYFGVAALVLSLIASVISVMISTRFFFWEPVAVFCILALALAAVICALIALWNGRRLLPIVAVLLSFANVTYLVVVFLILLRNPST